MPISGVALAGSAVADTWGLLSHLDSPLWLAAVLSVLALDLNRYAQHIALHRVPWLWRVHRLHHSDLDCDVTTQWRFHPFESVFSVGCFSLFIVGLGLPPEGVFLHAVLVGVLGFIQHGNARYPRGLDVAATTLIVTPDMHRIHHSALQRESNSNFGSLMSCWDRLFGTYLAEPSMPHEVMPMGLRDVERRRCVTLFWMLVDPFLPSHQIEETSVA